MLIRKNTKEYKAVSNLIHEYADKDMSAQHKNIELYAVKNGKSLEDKISLKDNELDYEMTFNTILESFNQNNYQLHRSDTHPQIYFFKSPNNKNWEQTPFEISKNLQSKLMSYADKVISQKKEKPQKISKPPVQKKKNESKKRKQRPSISRKQSKHIPEPKKSSSDSQIQKIDYKHKTWYLIDDSTGILALKYDFGDTILFIIFRGNNDLYKYSKVTKNTFLEIMKQENIATFINQVFKKKFTGEYFGKIDIHDADAIIFHSKHPK